MPPALINDCFFHDKDRLRHDQVLELLKKRLNCIVENETVDLSSALGRVLGEDITSPYNIPLHNNAAVDGYAYRHDDLQNSQPKSSLLIGAKIAAGDLNPDSLTPGTAARIFTGAIIPNGADTIVMQEDCEVINGTVTLPKALKKGANSRQAGEDLKKGDMVLKTGTRLRAADLCALASIGHTKAKVRRLLKVALFSNGNEVVTPGASRNPLLPGQVYDANQPLLSALGASLPVEIENCGIIEDTLKAARNAITNASKKYDVIITTAGASRGSEDYMLTVLDELGKRHLWQLAIKPGRPMMFGQIPRSNNQSDCLFFGLPGNPVASMVCFLLYTRPALLNLAGAKWDTPPRFQVPANFEITNKKPDRREFLRGQLITGDDGALSVGKFARDGSGLISSLRESEGLIEIPEHVTGVKKGELVSFIPYTGFG